MSLFTRRKFIAIGSHCAAACAGAHAVERPPPPLPAWTDGDRPAAALPPFSGHTGMPVFGFMAEMEHWYQHSADTLHAGQPVMLLGYWKRGDKSPRIYMHERASQVPANGGTVIGSGASGRLHLYGQWDVLDFGARNDGSADCSDAVRRAQAVGNVHYPAGTYLQRAVQPLSNRRYHGAGIGRTILKKDNLAPSYRSIFVISPVDTLGEGYPTGPVENIEICQMTIDFNFGQDNRGIPVGWIDFNPPIHFRGAGHAIRNIHLHHLAFIDSGQVPHPESYTGSRWDHARWGPLPPSGGNDAWCINGGTASPTTCVRIEHCQFLAKGHQWVAGFQNIDGLWFTHNFCQWGHANGFSCTTFTEREDVCFRNIVFSDNICHNCQSGFFFLGYDPGHGRMPSGRVTAENITVDRNAFHLSSRGVPNSSYFPRIARFDGCSGGYVNVSVCDNKVFFADDYDGRDPMLVHLSGEGYLNRQPLSTTAEFLQPAAGNDVMLMLGKITWKSGQLLFSIGEYLAVEGAGYFRIMACDASRAAVTARRLDLFEQASTGARIAAGAAVRIMNAPSRNWRISGNQTGPRPWVGYVSLGGSQLLEDISMVGNQGLRIALHCPVIKFNAANNTDFYGAFFNNLTGGIIGNGCDAFVSGEVTPLYFCAETRTETGFAPRFRCQVACNYLLEANESASEAFGMIHEKDALGDTEFENYYFGNRSGPTRNARPLRIDPRSGSTGSGNVYPATDGHSNGPW